MTCGVICTHEEGDCQGEADPVLECYKQSRGVTHNGEASVDSTVPFLDWNDIYFKHLDTYQTFTEPSVLGAVESPFSLPSWNSSYLRTD